MAKKTVKKQPLKTAAKTAVKGAAKAVAKTVAKIVKKVGDVNKFKPPKSTSKKVEKVRQPVSAVGTKKAEVKKAKKTSVITPPKAQTKETGAKTKSKGSIKVVESDVDKPVEAEIERDAEEAAPVSVAKVAKVKAEKIKAPKKKTAAQKKKEKLEIDSNAKWADLFEKYKQVKPVSYSMRDAFEANQPLQHKVLGWGWVMSSENDRLEVLFKDGKKILISNYKS